MNILMTDGKPANKRLVVPSRDIRRALAQVADKYGPVERYVVRHGDNLAIYWRVE